MNNNYKLTNAQIKRKRSLSISSQQSLVLFSFNCFQLVQENKENQKSKNDVDGDEADEIKPLRAPRIKSCLKRSDSNTKLDQSSRSQQRRGSLNEENIKRVQFKLNFN